MRQKHSLAKCDECGACFEDEALLQRHMKMHSQVTMFMCAICGSTFTKKSYLTFHMVVHEKEDLSERMSMKEVDEGKVPALPPKGQKQLQIVDDDEDDDDVGDGGNDPDDIDWEEPLAAKKKGSKFDCDRCSRSCASLRGLKMHQRMLHITVEEEPQSESSEEEEDAKTEEDAMIEKKGGNDKSKHCPVCKKSFVSVRQLTRHESTHASWDCTYCSKTFRTSWILKEHLNTHTGQRPYQCTECDKTFKSHGALRRHTIIHKGTKPYRCDLCDMRFSDGSSLKSHKKRRSCR
ncbi:zinc finger protein 91-like [Strongylocentrotus purpuratus]|uniref:C2H2-type domain-containing protein n=1 Tax=Strongylocentrotus purpuratus TaxID=7668 RepID=A0A7M7PIJ2_STRPU|nr:zinc finger protein 91-like [Strongylocentrotus purpuratus]